MGFKILLIFSLSQLVQSEIVAESCAVRCRELGIPFFRFSPQLREEVASGETKTAKLVNMILHTRLYLQSSSSPMGDLTTCFQKIAEGYTASRGALFSDSDILSSDSTSPALSSPGMLMCVLACVSNVHSQCVLCNFCCTSTGHTQVTHYHISTSRSV